MLVSSLAVVSRFAGVAASSSASMRCSSGKIAKLKHEALFFTGRWTKLGGRDVGSRLYG